MASQLARPAFTEAWVVPLGAKIKQLRKEQGWGQDELAQKVATVAPQISRYENGKIVPSTEMIVKLAEAFDVSIDYLLVEGALRRPLSPVPAGRIADRIDDLEKLPEEDQATLLRVADALLTKNKIKSLAAEAG